MMRLRDANPLESAAMNTQRSNVLVGKTRVCPHCKSVILDSANICPACQHHLRFGQNIRKDTARKYSAFHVEGSFTHSVEASPCEYSVVVVIRNGQGQEIKRQVIDVGAMDPDEQRTFDLSVDVSVPQR
jgi:hypothetical protein